jgi:hypothetical protein
MNINIGSAGSKKTNRLGDMVGFVVLAGELIALVQWTGVHDWLGTIVHSEVARMVIYAAVFIALSIWGLAVWPRIQGAVYSTVWIAGFGAIGVFFLYLSIAERYGRGFSLIYGPFFLAQAMIGVAGLARLMAAGRGQRK